MILNLGSARPRYFLNIYPLTFIPIISFIRKIEHKKIFSAFLIFVLLNPLDVYRELKNIYKYSDYSGWNFMMPHIDKINEDAGNNSFDISANSYYPILLLRIDNKNFTADTNSNIKYHIINSRDNNTNFYNMKIIYSNKAYITYKEYKTNALIN